MWDDGEKELRTIFVVGCWESSCNLHVLKICNLGKDRFIVSNSFALDEISQKRAT